MLTSKQIEFCKQVSMAISATEAYKIAYKSNSPGTCKVNGSKLLKSPEIKAKIEELKSLNKEVVKKATQKAVDKQVTREIASPAERMEVLTKTMRGQLKIQKAIVIGGKVKMISVEPDHTDRRNAIAELNKMDGEYAAAKTEIKQTNLNYNTELLSDEEIKRIAQSLEEQV